MREGFSEGRGAASPPHRLRSMDGSASVFAALMGPVSLLDVDRAIELSTTIEHADITWFEEPIDPDDYDGYRRIASCTSIPLAAGENGHSLPDFDLLMRHGALRFIQPDASTCGGITSWLRVAKMA